MRISKDFGHITPIVIDGEKKFAVDIMKCDKTTKYLDTLSNFYANTGYTPAPVIIENITRHFNASNDTYYTLRYWLNTSENHSCLVYNSFSNKYCLCRLDTYKYIFKEKPIYNDNVFVYEFEVCKLNCDSSGFTAYGYDEAFSVWKQNKENELNKLIIQKDTEDKKRYQKAKDNNQKKQDEKMRLLYEEGKFISKDGLGKPIFPEIEDVTINKNGVRYVLQLSDKDIMEHLNKVFNADDIMFKKLLNVMISPYDTEIEALKRLFEYYSSQPSNQENTIKLRILRHILNS